MKKITLLILILFFGKASTLAVDFPAKPNPPHLVNDFAGVLSSDQVQQLEQKLLLFEDTTTIQLAVVILKSLDGYPISDYAFQLGEKWGIGQAKNNTGVLLLIAINDRQLYIATGYGLEGALPDVMCKRIIENDIKPYFKQSDYYGGIDNGTDQLIALSKGEYKGTPHRSADDGPVWLPFLIIFSILFIIIIIKVSSVKRYSRLNSIPFWTAWQLLAAAQATRRGRWRDFTGGSGTFGGFGGGSGGGGGFGGFGGGGFGGGGAGGSW